jgi:hypothetical protein
MTLTIKPIGRGNHRRSTVFCSMSEYEAVQMVGKMIQMGGKLYRVIGVA